MRSLLDRYTVLYAEDEQNVRENMAELLRTYFKEIYLASDGKEAYELYVSKKPDVLLLDINMPHIDGLSLADKVRQKDKNVRILMLSAYTDKDKLLSATELNLTKYLVKPVKPSELKDALAKVGRELLEYSWHSIKVGEEHIWSVLDKKLFFDNKEVVLTHKERTLLELLISKRGHCVTHEDIMAIVWIDQYDEEISKDSVKSQVNYLRKKLPDNIIENVYGKGYLLKVK